MLGLMQNQPLLQSSLIEFAAANHGDTEIVSRRVEGDIHRYTWADAARRARQLAHALDGLGLTTDARVGTLAWNGYRHLELYYGVSGTGRIIHTINLFYFINVRLVYLTKKHVRYIGLNNREIRSSGL